MTIQWLGWNLAIVTPPEPARHRIMGKPSGGTARRWIWAATPSLTHCVVSATVMQQDMVCGRIGTRLVNDTVRRQKPATLNRNTSVPDAMPRDTEFSRIWQRPCVYKKAATNVIENKRYYGHPGAMRCLGDCFGIRNFGNFPEVDLWKYLISQFKEVFEMLTVKRISSNYFCR